MGIAKRSRWTSKNRIVWGALMLLLVMTAQVTVACSERESERSVRATPQPTCPWVMPFGVCLSPKEAEESKGQMRQTLEEYLDSLRRDDFEGARWFIAASRCDERDVQDKLHHDWLYANFSDSQVFALVDLSADNAGAIHTFFDFQDLDDMPGVIFALERSDEEASWFVVCQHD